MATPYCAGIIVFNNDKTVLVCTPKGHYGFPKGKRNKGEDILATAWRELQEETGLTADNVKLIDGITIDEKSDKGKLAVTYYVGILTKAIKEFKFDNTELSKVEWVQVNKAYKLDKLRDRRKDILKAAYEQCQLRN